MKFSYDNQPTETREVVAELHKFSDGDNLCLAVKAQSGKYIWFYHNSLPSIQTTGFPEDGDRLIKRFYKGDSITITF